MPNLSIVAGAAGLMLFCSGMYVGQVLRPQPAPVHPLTVEGVLWAHQREVALDAEDLVVAGDAPHRHRETRDLGDVEVVVTARLLFADA